MQTNQDWRQHAACRGTDPNLWFPPFNVPVKSPLEQRRVADAKAVCAGCPVTAECLTFAMEEEPIRGGHGVWGGLSPQERGAMRDRARKQRARVARSSA